ncbi:MAG: nucleotidyltransferase family protein [archaeon]|nr:nucleotidyltransferase family protein [archaeon]
MKALVLAAGYATRLYPLTINRPKALLEIKGKTILDHIIDRIEAVKQVEEILIVTNSKFSLAFEQWAAERKTTKPLKIINDTTMSDEDRLGAIGDLEYVVEMEKIVDDFLVVAGDNLFQFSLAKFVDFFREKNSSVIACRDIKNLEVLSKKYGVVELGENQKITGFEEKPENPKTTIAATACYVFKKDDLSLLKLYIKEGNNLENAGEFVKYISSKRDVYGFVFTEKWFDIGSFEELGRAREEFDG